MAYRTRSGKRYHLMLGCYGATISCGEAGLSPCSRCVSKGAGGKAGDEGTAGVGGSPSGVASDGRQGNASVTDGMQEATRSDRPDITRLDATLRTVMPDGVGEVSDALASAGFPCHAVGGCVRDSLMGRNPHDWDLTTSATVEQMRDVFAKAGIKTYDTGVQHGTITAVPSDGEPYEVTTYRIDGDYSDGRHPDEVVFTDRLEDDLVRRDLTINAIAWSPDDGIVDPFDGIGDIRRGTIRAVGNPYDRMTEDGLRVMRAMRFASVLGFEMDAETASAVHGCLPMLDSVSWERKRDELTKMLASEDTASLARMMREYPDVIFSVVPELGATATTPQKHPWHRFDNVWDHTVEVVANTPNDPHVRLAALLHDSGKPSCLEIHEEDDGRTSFHGHPSISADLARAALDRLRCDTKTRDRVCLLVAEHDRHVSPTRRSVRRAFVRFGSREVFDEWMALRRADVMGQSDYAQSQELPKLDEIRRVADELEAQESVFSMRDMRLRGADLLGMGMRTGPAVGRILKDAFDLVLDGTLPNERDALLAYATERVAGLSG